jgi:acyl carrier protein
MTTTPDGVREFVRTYILKEFLPGVDAAELTDDTPLISGGILDSLATVKLVAVLEEKFGIEIHAHEASVTHLNTVSDIASLIIEKKS